MNILDCEGQFLFCGSARRGFGLKPIVLSDGGLVFSIFRNSALARRMRPRKAKSGAVERARSLANEIDAASARLSLPSAKKLKRFRIYFGSEKNGR
jgi:hypothetical protein